MEYSNHDYWNDLQGWRCHYCYNMITWDNILVYSVVTLKQWFDHVFINYQVLFAMNFKKFQLSTLVNLYDHSSSNVDCFIIVLLSWQLNSGFMYAIVIDKIILNALLGNKGISKLVRQDLHYNHQQKQNTFGFSRARIRPFWRIAGLCASLSSRCQRRTRYLIT